MQATNEPPADADFRLLTCGVAGDVERAPAECLTDRDWAPGQMFGRDARTRGVDGILYPSVRYPAGRAAAMFWPDCLVLPINQTRQYRYRWNGTRMTHCLPHDAKAWTPWPLLGVAEGA